MVKRRRTFLFVFCAGVLGLVAMAIGRGTPAILAPSPPLDAAAGTATTGDGLQALVDAMARRVQADSRDTTAAVSLADAFLRQGRVTGNPALAVRAEQALRRAASADATNYEVQRMIATVLLSQHRFHEAIAAAQAAQERQPGDAWNDGVIGDARLELGEYEEAFDAFDRMMARRPSASAYARVSYARELQGDLDGAVQMMEMALEAASASDVEATAWYESQLGHLSFERGNLPEATRHFERARFMFAEYPLAIEGIVRVLVAKGAYGEAYAAARRQHEALPSGALGALLGDLSQQLGYPDAERFYRDAERLWRSEPAALARFLADRDRDIPRAVEVATQAAASRRDIYTNDALAWALHKAGRTDEALSAARRALATGTRDRHVLAHAASIHQAAGLSSSAQQLARRALTGHPHFDIVGAVEAAAVVPGVGESAQ